MSSQRQHSRWTGRMLLAACVATIVAVGCASDEPEPDPVPTDAPVIDEDVDPGVETETDEGRNAGFEDDEPSGNQSDVNE